MAGKGGMTPAWACHLMKLTRLAPDIQEQILALTTTPGFHVTERKLRAFVCCERDWDRQREQFAKLLAGELELPPPNGGRAPARRRRVPTVMGS